MEIGRLKIALTLGLCLLLSVLWLLLPMLPARGQFTIPISTGALANAPSGPILSAYGTTGCSTGTSCATTVTGMQSGDLAIVWFGSCGKSNVTLSISDSNSDSFNQRVMMNTTADENFAAWDTTLSAGGSVTFTATMSVSTCYPTVDVASFTNVTAAAFDQVGSSSIISGSPPNPYTQATSGNLAQSNELIFGFSRIGGTSQTLTPSSGFTAISGSGADQADEYQIGGTAGTTASASFAQVNGGNPSAIGVLTYK